LIDWLGTRVQSDEHPRKRSFRDPGHPRRQQPDPTTGRGDDPGVPDSTYAQSSPPQGLRYSRTRNPTRDALQCCLAAAGEPERRALAFASGLAATAAVLHLLSSGDHVVLSDDLYGGTFALADKVFKRLGHRAELRGT